MSNGKRMGYSMKELNQIHLLDFLKITKIHFGISNGENVKKPEVKPANQNNINSLLS
jgi:hypothetical protein